MPAHRHAALAGCAWLRRLLPELAAELEPLPGGTLPPEQERRLTFAAVARLLANVAGPQGTLLVLDDLQWADPAALDLLATLVRSPSPAHGVRARGSVGRLRVVGAYRDTEVRPVDPLGLLLADLARAGLARHQAVTPLGATEAAALLDALLVGVTETGWARAGGALERAGGVPLFLVSYAQAVRTGAEEGVPWDLAQGVRQRVALLPPAAQHLLGVAAIAGRRAQGTVLLAAAGQAEDDMLDGLEAACRAHLLLEEGEDAYVFAHDVIREVVEGDLGAARRVVLHRRVAEALEAQAEAAAPELLAYHYGRSLQHEKALPHLEAAGDRALAQYAYERAESHYRDLVERLEGLDRQADAARVEEKLANLLRWLGRFDEAQEMLQGTIARYRKLGDLVGAGRATGLLGLVLDKQGTPEQARRLLEEMAQQLDAGGLVVGLSDAGAQVWEQLATVFGSQGQYEEMLRAAQRTAEVARAIGHQSLRARAEKQRGLALNCLGRIDEARQALEAAMVLLEEAGDLLELIGAVANLGENRRLAGELVGALRLNERALELAVQAGIGRSEMAQHLNRAEILMAAGQWERARQHIVRAEEIGHTQEAAAYVAAVLPYHRGELALRKGYWDQAAQQFHLAVTRAVGVHHYIVEAAQTLQAELELLQGKPLQARHRLTDVLGQEGANLPLILPVLAWSFQETGEIERALELAQEAERETRERQTLLYLPECLRMRGKALTRLGRTEEAREVLMEGRMRARAMPAPYTEARLLVELGLLDRQDSKDEGARERLEEALAIFRQLGAYQDAERTERSLATLQAGHGFAGAGGLLHHVRATTSGAPG
jgi:tetratricopeptide (TPR) repeat protein/DUF971 family protein